MKKFSFALIISFALISCGVNTTNSFVNINRLFSSTFQSQIEQSEALNYKKAKNPLLSNVSSSTTQELILIEEENEIIFTIYLENPKGESVDAIELSSTDEESLVLVDNEYKKIRINGDRRILNWAQEDPYEKTYYLKIFDTSKPVNIEVIDLKVNGVWQNKTLNNNVMEIHKLPQSDYSFSMIHNTFDEYRFSINHSSKIENLVVKEAIQNNDSSYSMRSEGVLEWSFDYVGTNKIIKRSNLKNIEFLKVVETYNIYQILVNSIRLWEDHDEANIKSFRHTFYIDWLTRFWIKIVAGTDVNFTQFEVSFDGGNRLLFIQGQNETPGFDLMDGLPTDFVFSNATIFIGGFEYTYDSQNLILPADTEPGDNSIFDLQ
jgi:hypothetical protein